MRPGPTVRSTTLHPGELPAIDDGSAAALLDEAEDILNTAGARIRAEVEVEQEEATRKRGIKDSSDARSESLTRLVIGGSSLAGGISPTPIEEFRLDACA